MTTIDIAPLKQGVLDYIQAPAIIDLVNRIMSGGVLKRLAGVVALVDHLTIVVEKLSDDLGYVQAGGAKKDALVEALDDAIKLNILLEQIDGPLIRAAIDVIISARNLMNGQHWLGKFIHLIRNEDGPDEG